MRFCMKGSVAAAQARSSGIDLHVSILVAITFARPNLLNRDSGYSNKSDYNADGTVRVH
eukprot:COSAG06_NODE_1022_length_11043_cov_4.966648_15_plen_59_part_00